ncbi:MAG: hypothetical protein L0212_04060 [Acidobacteria bacterium]|nr:hypothetical protein [Acidobacteriota bacterium]
MRQVICGADFITGTVVVIDSAQLTLDNFEAPATFADFEAANDGGTLADVVHGVQLTYL